VIVDTTIVRAGAMAQRDQGKVQIFGEPVIVQVHAAQRRTAFEREALRQHGMLRHRAEQPGQAVVPFDRGLGNAQRVLLAELAASLDIKPIGEPGDVSLRDHQ
jgi:hypothetical protein